MDLVPLFMFVPYGIAAMWGIFYHRNKLELLPESNTLSIVVTGNIAAMFFGILLMGDVYGGEVTPALVGMYVFFLLLNLLGVRAVQRMRRRKAKVATW